MTINIKKTKHPADLFFCQEENSVDWSIQTALLCYPLEQTVVKFLDEGSSSISSAWTRRFMALIISASHSLVLTDINLFKYFILQTISQGI